MYMYTKKTLFHNVFGFFTKSEIFNKFILTMIFVGYIITVVKEEVYIYEKIIRIISSGGIIVFDDSL